MSRKNNEIIKDVLEIRKKVVGLTVCNDLESIREKYKVVRQEISDKTGDNFPLKKLMYFTSSFDFSLEQIQNEVEQLISYLMEHLDE